MVKHYLIIAANSINYKGLRLELKNLTEIPHW